MIKTARNTTRELQRGTRQIKDLIAEEIKEMWQGKRMQGQFPRNLLEKLVDNEQSYRWLNFGDIKGEQRVQYWQLKTKQLVQTLLKIKF
jgi:IS30 family transposase